ncbi:MAG TPA: alpha/beta hydrolase [Sporichthya sp.]|nr:alpha/beta hydrolase [Sporichthya sp.]
MRTFVATLAAGTLVAGVVATTAGNPTASAAPSASKISWSACQDETLAAAKAECGFLDVPLDWAKPAGEKIQVAVSRVKGTAAKSQGVMLINPGGPGGSGLGFSAYLAELLPAEVSSQYDLIGFDPRGVGASKPAVSCIANYAAGPRPAYTPTKATKGPNELAWIKRTKAYAKACADNNGPIIEHMRTSDTIQDMDALRAALGVQQINFFGFSYGTFLGQTYSTRYPDRVRRMVLAGNVDPTNYGGYADGGKAQTTAFQGVLNVWFDWIAKHDSTYHLGATPAAVLQTYHDMIAKLTAAPVGTIGPSELADVFFTGAYSEGLWVPITAAVADAHEGNFDFLTRVYGILNDPTNDNTYAAFNTTLCSDGKFPRNYERIRKDAFDLAKQAPDSTWSSFWFSAPCTYWPVKAGTTPPVDGSKVKIPFLLVQQTLDGATPYAGGLQVRSEFPTSAMVSEVGATTHASVYAGNKCLDDVITAYLLNGTLPTRASGNTADVSCQRIPFPEPSVVDRALPQGQLGSYAGLPPEVAAVVNKVPL